MRAKNGVAFFPEPDAIETIPKKFKDGCGHEDYEYIGSVFLMHKHGQQPVDVYLHDQDGCAHVCIRFGNESSEYISAGHVLGFLMLAAKHCNDKFYPEVATLLLSRVDFFCEPKPRV